MAGKGAVVFVVFVYSVDLISWLRHFASCYSAGGSTSSRSPAVYSVFRPAFSVGGFFPLCAEGLAFPSSLPGGFLSLTVWLVTYPSRTSRTTVNRPVEKCEGPTLTIRNRVIHKNAGVFTLKNMRFSKS